jgi:hypothetical protein
VSPIQLREPGKALLRHCPSCERDAFVLLPSHPAGLAECTHCGALLDLADDESLQVAEYLAQYDRT